MSDLSCPVYNVTSGIKTEQISVVHSIPVALVQVVCACSALAGDHPEANPFGRETDQASLLRFDAVSARMAVLSGGLGALRDRRTTSNPLVCRVGLASDRT
jgi:hypothetical protein